MPLTAGSRISLRDASQEQSASPEFLQTPIIHMRWARDFLIVALLPTLVLLAAGALLPTQLFSLFYGYILPQEHASFIRLYYAACALGQIGNLYLILLRATKNNRSATINFLSSELIVQVGLMALLVALGLATPATTGFVVIMFCGSYLILNYLSFQRIKTHA